MIEKPITPPTNMPKDTQSTLDRLQKIARNSPAESVSYLAQVMHDLALVVIGAVQKVKEQGERLAILLAVAQAAEEGGQEAVDAIIQEVEDAIQNQEQVADGAAVEG